MNRIPKVEKDSAFWEKLQCGHRRRRQREVLVPAMAKLWFFQKGSVWEEARHQ